MTMSQKNREVPTLYGEKISCCGCSACFAICPVKAIQMVADQEGFLYPTIDSEKCICCYKCLQVCNFKKKQMNRENGDKE